VGHSSTTIILVASFRAISEDSIHDEARRESLATLDKPGKRGWRGTNRRETFLLRLDRKPHNIFLGEPPEAPDFANGSTSIYPEIKLADYGLVALFGNVNLIPNHPKKFYGLGTRASGPLNKPYSAQNGYAPQTASNLSPEPKRPEPPVRM
jgi:hypothetical protein